MEFSNWNKGQPDNFYDEGEHCVHLDLSWAWNDFNCYTEMSAVCQDKIVQ